MIKVSDPVRYAELMKQAYDAVLAARSYLPDVYDVPKWDRDPLYFCIGVQSDLRTMLLLVDCPAVQLDMYGESR